MQYRKFGALDFDVSVLGFGAMRLPTRKDGDKRVIDEPEAQKMLAYAVEHGVNYIDTAYPYHRGQSEGFVGNFLKTGYRDTMKVATKLPSWKIEQPADFDTYFNEQTERLQVEQIDFYLLHCLYKNSWAKIRDFGVLDWAEQKIKDGRIRHLGFSFHDSLPVFTKIIDAYDWTFCQVQYNYIDIDTQPGTEGVKYAASKDIAVIAMEPIMGGRLVDPPEPIQRLWDSAETTRSAADWALQWLWNQSTISLVLSGMSTMQQVEENVASADASRVGILNDAEVALVGKVREQYNRLQAIPCTKCEYCMPCPSGVNIPRNFRVYNLGITYGQPNNARKTYNNVMGEAVRAGNCAQCQKCEPKCPQHIPISQWMPVVHDVLGNGQPYQTSL